MSKVAIITGGARGIGRACAIKFANNGYRIAVIYRNSRDKACELVKLINCDGELKAIAIMANVANSIEVDNAVREVIKVFGRIDVIVNNAGISLSKLLIDTTNEDWRSIINVDLDGVFYMSRAALSHMLDNGGSIVNISSIWGLRGAAGEVAYSTAKAGMIGFTKALSKELAYNKIRVNCVAPGVTDTDMMKDYSQQDINDIIARIPIGRMAMAEEIADAVFFMATSEYITGEILEVSAAFE